MELIATVHVAFIVSLLFSVIKLITCQGQVQTPPTVSVTEGETATISCQFDRSAELVGLEWKRGEDANSADDLIRLFKGRKMPPSDPRFDMTSDYALTINGTTLADNGIYWCQVTLLGVFQSATNLTVLPGRIFFIIHICRGLKTQVPVIFGET
ncbi:cell adhesion molecule 1-like [Lytechinus variegatus]|uniref:cell adhesion molecule 1-like n=1 Tax=Lytechinus variegatus TaxID=7654 RepID=UPI001BB18625|nr:cell adhesion molecule 1-like [Lytechinus variegatus]